MLFLGSPGGTFHADQIRVMKGMFLLSKEGPSAARNLYAFRPYDYGPFDAQVYQDLDQLAQELLVECEPIDPGSNRKLYRLTARGEQRYRALAASVDTSELNDVREAKRVTTSKSFLGLLEYVYDRYPEYSVRSVLRR